MLIKWRNEVRISAVSRLMGLSWNAIDEIMQPGVARGGTRSSFRQASSSVTAVCKYG